MGFEQLQILPLARKRCGQPVTVVLNRSMKASCVRACNDSTLPETFVLDRISQVSQLGQRLERLVGQLQGQRHELADVPGQRSVRVVVPPQPSHGNLKTQNPGQLNM